MNKKGFTLVELLAIVILLSVIFSLVYPKITEILEKQKNDIDEITLNLIYEASSKYLENYLESYLESEKLDSSNSLTVGKIYCIQVSELDNKNLIPVDVTDYNTKKVEVKIGKGGIYNKFVDKCSDESIKIGVSKTNQEETENKEQTKDVVPIFDVECDTNKTIDASCISGSSKCETQYKQYKIQIINGEATCYDQRYIDNNGEFLEGKSIQASLVKSGNCSDSELYIGGFCHKIVSRTTNFKCDEGYTLDQEKMKCKLNESN